MGRRNEPFYRVVAADSRFATSGRFLENLGWYDPKKVDQNFSLNLERVDYWLDSGAQVSNTAKSLVTKAKAGGGVPFGSSPEKKDALKPIEIGAEPSGKPEKAEESASEPDVSADLSDEASAKAEAEESEKEVKEEEAPAEQAKPEAVKADEPKQDA